MSPGGLLLDFWIDYIFIHLIPKIYSKTVNKNTLIRTFFSKKNMSQARGEQE